MRRSAVRAARLLALPAAAVLMAACAAGSASSGSTAGGAAPSTSAPPSVTKVVHFVPSGTATTTLSGSCWTSSITVASAAAYRCFAGNRILDPCFAESRRGVDCFAAPWSPPVRIRLDAALPDAAPLAFSHPWALQLAGGTRCLAVTGVATRDRGVALVYRCGDGGATSAPVDHGGRWSVQRTAAGSRDLRSVEVSVMWSA